MTPADLHPEPGRLGRGSLGRRLLGATATPALVACALGCAAESPGSTSLRAVTIQSPLGSPPPRYRVVMVDATSRVSTATVRGRTMAAGSAAPGRFSHRETARGA
jgi:hypothetical protein